MVYKLQSLPFKYDALEPFIDAETMKFHHDGHHKAYTEKLNLVLVDYDDLAGMPAEELLKNLDGMPVEIRNAVRNFGGGYVNHNFLWSILGKGGKFIRAEIIRKMKV